MERKLFYTKYILTCFRIISILCSLLLLITLLLSIHNKTFLGIKDGVFVNTYYFFYTLLNILNFFLFGFTVFFPQKIGFCALVAFTYSFSIIILEPDNYMGILMFFLGTAVLFARGFMKRNTKKKLVILTVLLIILMLTHLRFGFIRFVTLFIENIGCILVMSLFAFFLRSYYLDTIYYEDKKLNLALYQGLDERDCKILKSIQQGIKYYAIAKDLNISLGHLKNRLHFIFQTIQCGDKQGFLSFFDDYDIFFEPVKKS